MKCSECKYQRIWFCAGGGFNCCLKKQFRARANTNFELNGCEFYEDRPPDFNVRDVSLKDIKGWKVIESEPEKMLSL